MFKAIALGAILSLNICCFGSSGLRRTPAGDFFDHKGEQTTAVRYYQALAKLGALGAPTQDGFIYRVGTQKVSLREYEIAILVHKAREAGEKLSKSPGSSDEIALLHLIANKLDTEHKTQAALLPKAETKCTIQ